MKKGNKNGMLTYKQQKDIIRLLRKENAELRNKIQKLESKETK